VLSIPWSEPLESDNLIVHTLRERSRKVEPKKGQRYSKEFRRQAVERMNSCGNIVGLARELGICRRALYNWRDRLDETNPPPARSRELILRKQIIKLKRLLANKTLEVDFFRHALQRVGARRRQRDIPGDKASTTE
jgi:transposase